MACGSRANHWLRAGSSLGVNVLRASGARTRPVIVDLPMRRALGAAGRIAQVGRHEAAVDHHDGAARELQGREQVIALDRRALTLAGSEAIDGGLELVKEGAGHPHLAELVLVRAPGGPVRFRERSAPGSP